MGWPLFLAAAVFAAVLPAGLSAAETKGVGESFFADKLYPVLEAAQCRLCHNDNGIATQTRVQFPPDDADPERITAFGYSLSAVVDRDAPEQSLLLRKPTQRIGHTGGERIRPGSREEDVLLRWIRHLAARSPEQIEGEIAAAETEARRPAGVRRLTHSQYNNSVRDLLHGETRPADEFPPEDFVHGFSNQTEGQGISPLLAEAYNRAARKLARTAFLGGDPYELVPCRPSGFDDESCRWKFIRSFGRKAFRRPLSDQETLAYGRVFEEAAQRVGDFYSGAQVVVEAMLQSPNFLFYGHTGSRSHRIAARLSYFLWNTTPDEQLLSHADEGRLRDPASVEKIARRMLDAPRARESFDEFLAQWLRFDRLLKAFRDVKLYPEFSVELASAMAEETRRLFRHLVWNGWDFMEFFTARYSFLNPALAKLYELPFPEKEFGRVEFPPESPRAGILGQGSFLTVTSKPGESSPTERGLFLREHFLCQVVPPPPAGVNTTLPPVTDEKPLNNREQLDIHLSNESCAACHRLIDPIGFGFEHFDAIGRFRETQLVKVFPTADELRTKRKTEPSDYQLAIDSSGFIAGLSDSSFASPQEAGEILANEEVCRRCIVKQLFRYAMGRPEAEADQAAIDWAYASFKESRFDFRKLIIAIAASEPFLNVGEEHGID